MKNDPLRVTVRCPMHGCPWRVHASHLQDGVTFQVKTMNAKHTCNHMKKVDIKMASSTWICDKILDNVKSNAKKSIADFQRDLEKKFNIKVPYHRVWATQEMALEKIHGKIEDSYKQIPDLHNQLLKHNPGSVVNTGFLVGCRPVIGVDSCHLKGKYKGVLLAATSIDGNHGIFPLAYAVCEEESAETWTWFLEF
ncbi:hypothetical protein QJS10_CPA16g00605 [Acorus calamus]|uniref:Transposase MuDR plant domain-containing protein n=1 Tax=Acorus calamus TaxID=4465 RepID=A0AAV9CYK6_ACOCL|nr:hypothetical protein QJS10_CPA16g00605 [Acorus calamus]